MKRKRIIIIILGTILALVTLIILANIIVSSYGKYSYSDLNNISPRYAALLLGTNKYLNDGRENQYYRNRIEAAIRLYSFGKCRKIVVSGDNRTKEYDEPGTMKGDLIKNGVKENDIICDYAGTRTLDSVIRFNKIFCQTNGIVVSQLFHNERAIFIARSNGIELIGYNADDVDRYSGFKTRFREIFSKVKSVIDVKIINKQPHHLGDRIEI